MTDHVFSEELLKRLLKEKGAKLEDLVDHMKDDPIGQRNFIAGMHSSNCLDCQKILQRAWDDVYQHSLENKK